MSQNPQQPASPPSQVPPQRTSARASASAGSAESGQGSAPTATTVPPTIRPAAGPVPPAARPGAARAQGAHGSQGSLGSAPAPTTPQPAPAGATGASSSKGVPGPRRVRLTLSHVDPWSVMKLSFLLSIAIGIMIVVASALVWTVLNQMGVFAKINDLMINDLKADSFKPLLEYLEFSRVLSVATVFAVIDIVLITALSTLAAFIYNFVATMVGGLHLTLTDD